MAGNDVFLYSVPSDANSNDVRLRSDPAAAATVQPLRLTNAPAYFNAKILVTYKPAALANSQSYFGPRILATY